MSSNKDITSELIEEEISAADLREEQSFVRLSDIDGLNHPRSVYSPKQKLMAVTLWFALGNMAEVHRRTGINYETIKEWKHKTDWWQEAIARLRLMKNDEMDAQLTRSMHRIMDEIEDRVDNGNEVLKKDGTKGRVKIPGKDLTVMMAVMQDKRALMRGDPTSSTGGTKSTQTEVLQQLAKSFENLSESIRKKEDEKVVSDQ